MKTRFTKVLALLLVAVMAMGCFAACGKKSGASANTMFAVIKEASAIEKATYEMKVTVPANGVEVPVSITGVKDGNNMSMSLNASYGGLELKFEDAIVMTKDSLFINIKKIVEPLAPLLANQGLDVSNLGLEKDWLYYTYEDIFKTDTSFSDLILDSCDTAYAEIITKDKDTYTIDISTVEQFEKFFELTSKMLTDNADAWADKVVELVNKYDIEAIAKDAVKKIVEEYNKTASVQITEDELNEKVEELSGQFKETVKKEDVKKGLEEAAKEVKEGKVGENDSAKIVVSRKDGVYSLKVEATADETDFGTITAEVTITKDSKASVTVPSTDDASSIFEMLAPFLSLAMSNAMNGSGDY